MVIFFLTYIYGTDYQIVMWPPPIPEKLLLLLLFNSNLINLHCDSYLSFSWKLRGRYMIFPWIILHLEKKSF